MAKTAPINMRVEPHKHALLTKAASLLKVDRSVFILDVACREAENVLLNRRIFLLDESTFNAFEAALTEPTPTNENLKALFAETAPWEK